MILGFAPKIPRHRYLEFTMTAYIPALIWLLSSLACQVLAKRRHVKKTAFRTMLVALAGPVAIPFLMAAKPQSFKQA
jgi:hypothetical protein